MLIKSFIYYLYNYLQSAVAMETFTHSEINPYIDSSHDSKHYHMKISLHGHFRFCQVFLK